MHWGYQSCVCLVIFDDNGLGGRRVRVLRLGRSLSSGIGWLSTSTWGCWLSSLLGVTSSVGGVAGCISVFRSSFVSVDGVDGVGGCRGPVGSLSFGGIWGSCHTCHSSRLGIGREYLIGFSKSATAGEVRVCWHGKFWWAMSALTALSLSSFPVYGSLFPRRMCLVVLTLTSALPLLWG